MQREQEASVPAAHVCSDQRASSPTFDELAAKLGGLNVSERDRRLPVPRSTSPGDGAEQNSAGRSLPVRSTLGGAGAGPATAFTHSGVNQQLAGTNAAGKAGHAHVS